MKASLLLGQVDGLALVLQDGTVVPTDLSDMAMVGELVLGRVVVLGLVGSGRSGGELQHAQRAHGVVCLALLFSMLCTDCVSGWTDNSWASSAPWTTWSACTASTTATSTTTVTTTDSAGSTITSVSAVYAIKVAEATGVATTTDSSGNVVTTTNSDSGAMPTNFAFAGSAAGIIGVLGAAVLL